jgi:hypothetical protein
MAVMQAVIVPAALKGQNRVQHQSELADAAVGDRALGPERAMHRIVSDDEQTGLQQGPSNHSKTHQEEGELAEAGGKQDRPASQPPENDSGGKPKAAPGGRHQRANFSNSAAEASRSMATK